MWLASLEPYGTPPVWPVHDLTANGIILYILMIEPDYHRKGVRLYFIRHRPKFIDCSNQTLMQSLLSPPAIVSHSIGLQEIDINEITKNIYIGDRHTAQNKTILRQLGIKAILVAGQ